MTDISISSSGGPMPAYANAPTGSGPWPGVVVLHDAFGMTKALRDQVDWLASEGFTAVAPNLFRAGAKVACVRAAMRDIAARKGQSFEDVEATRAWLTAQARCTGKVGVIGFCLGGSFALALAPTGKYAAASVNYGRLPADAEAQLAAACPTITSYGARDPTLRGATKRLEAIFSAHGTPHDTKEYPDAGHSFMEDHDSSEIPALIAFFKWAMGATYHEPSTVDARRRIVAFFGEHLR